jgi:hypothetical protein
MAKTDVTAQVAATASMTPARPGGSLPDRESEVTGIHTSNVDASTEGILGPHARARADTSHLP